MPDIAIADANRPDADRPGVDNTAELEREIASLRRLLAERTAERDEALEQQNAAAEVLQVINSSPGDLAPVFETILAKAHNLCAADFGGLLVYDGDQFRAAALHNVPPSFAVLAQRPFRPGPKNRLTNLIQGESLAHVADYRDVLAEAPDDPMVRAAVEVGGIRTLLLVPLRKDGALLGVITAYRQEVRPFTDRQIALLQNFAAQAVIAMENARLLTETREALEQQTATAEVLQVINASPGDLAPVFDAILKKAHTLCRAVQGAMFLFDDGHFRAVATRGMPEAFNARMRAGMRGEGYPLTEPLLAGEWFNQIVDIALIDHPITRAAVEIAGARTVLAVALRKDNLLLGMIVAARREVRPFSDKEIALIENFAAQAVIAMENARLLTETREALEQQTATAEVLQVINASPGALAPVFDAMLEKALRLCEASFGVLRTYDGEQLHTAATRGVPEVYAEFAQAPQRIVPHGVTVRLLEGENFIHILDLREDESYQRHAPLARALVDLGGARSYLSVPLRKDAQLVGVIGVYRKDIRPFSEKQITLLQNFAAQAVIAMENARLLTETREALEQQTATAEVLQVINASPGDLAPVFDAMLEKAIQLCGAAHGTLRTYDDEVFHLAAARGEADYVDAAWQFPTIRPSQNHSLYSSFLNGDDVRHIGNAFDSEEYKLNPTVRRAFDDAGIRTWLGVALRKEDRLLGVIAILRREVRPFTAKQISLLENFAAQAVIAMDNARLLTETREALEQQTATAEVLQVINASPGDLAPVFEAMLEKAVRLCDASFGQLVTSTEGEIFTIAAAQGPPAIVEFLRNRPPTRPGPGTSIYRLVRGERSVHIHDVMAEEAYRRGDPTRRALVDLGGCRTLVSVGLRKDDALLGMISVYRSEVKPFSTTEIALLENFAAQAVIAMENARLLTETREALEQQTATAEVLQVINASPGDLAPVFDAMLQKAVRLCDAAHGVLRTFDGQFFNLVAMHGEPDAVESLKQLGPIDIGPVDANDMLGPIVLSEPVVHIADARDTILYRDNPIGRERIDRANQRTWLAVALRKDGVLLGVIMTYRTVVRPFTEKQIALLQNFAAQAVIAMENARLLTETREALEQQTATAEVLQVINASPGELEPVFDTMLERATRLCDAAFGTVSTVTEEGYVNHRSYSGPPEIVEFFKNRPINRPGPGTTMDRLIRGESCVQVPDLTATEAYRQGDPVRRAMVDAAGARTLISVALRKDSTLLGTLSAYRQEVRPFTDKQIALLENFAAQAVIAMENARLLGELRARNDEIAGWNRELEERVQAQVAELERTGKLKRFLAPQLAELIVARGDENILETHRRDIVVVFCDLRGFTAFAETAEPEEVLDLLREYHGALGPVVAASEGTLDHFSGDGIMVFFNDPVPVPDASERAVQMAIEMRAAMALLQARWRRQGREIGFGAGIARGYATLGQIGFADRIDYTAIGTVCNLAARLCAEAKDGQILISRRVAAAVEDTVRLEEIGDLALKGLMQAVAVYNVAAE